MRRRDIKWRTNHAPFERRRPKRFFYFQMIYCVRAITSEAWRGGRGADLNLLTALKLCNLGPADNYGNESEYAD